MLLDKALGSLQARGVRIDRDQLESLIESAEGEDLAAILSVADCVLQIALCTVKDVPSFFRSRD